MTDRQPGPTSDATIRVGVVILATTVSALRIIIWLWEALARRDWWGQPEDGGQVIAAILAVAVNWIIWGQVDYWLTNPDDIVTSGQSLPAPSEIRPDQP
jgi:hypothetical protein